MSASNDSLFSKPGAIVFVGGGNMARSLIGGLIAGGVEAAAISVVDPQAETRQGLVEQFAVDTHADGQDVIAHAAIVVLAVKPQVMHAVCSALLPFLPKPSPLFISVAAGITTGQLDRWLDGDCAVVRCMPNTPALLGAGACGMYANAAVNAVQRQQAERVLAGTGLTCWVEHEALMDTVTGLSGSGPAYFFAFVEALEEAAVAQGLPRDTARALACQTCLGAGRMLVENSSAPAELRRQVTSPGGTTAAGLASFAASDLDRIVAKAVAAATARGGELSAEMD